LNIDKISLGEGMFKYKKFFNEPAPALASAPALAPTGAFAPTLAPPPAPEGVFGTDQPPFGMTLTRKV
jgi:hypothetical protein